MFAWLGKEKPEAAPVAAAPRDRQKNLKASADCIKAFAAIAKAEGVSEAALFEELVAERYDALCAQGVIKRARG
jgi:hypothetical protein